jgi:ribosomal protein S18 acetylase RimI-like enzyme
LEHLLSRSYNVDMELIIKKEDLSDTLAEVIFKIVKQSFTREFDPQTKDVEVVKAYLKKCDVYFLYDKNEQIGYFALWNKSDAEIELKSIALLPNFQDKGLGSKMLDKVIELSRGKRLSLVVHPLNISAIIAYLNKGFVIVTRKENYFGDGQPRLILEKKVA